MNIKQLIKEAIVPVEHNSGWSCIPSQFHVPLMRESVMNSPHFHPAVHSLNVPSDSDGTAYTVPFKHYYLEKIYGKRDADTVKKKTYNLYAKIHGIEFTRRPGHPNEYRGHRVRFEGVDGKFYNEEGQHIA